MAHLIDIRRSPAADITTILGSPTPLPPRSPTSPTAPTIKPLTKISSKVMALRPPPRCLFFDVFGTCVDWRKTVTAALTEASHKALNASDKSLASSVRVRVGDTDWADVAQEWRQSYLAFTQALANDSSIPWKSVDDHHLDSLRKILLSHGIVRESLDDPPNLEPGGLWNNDELRALSLIWHRLDPWPDTCNGIAALNTIFWTCTLTNGNLSLIKDMAAHAGMPFTHIFSAEMFGSYKPSPKIYLGAAEKLNLAPKECAMVAAHLRDLKAAKECGFQTIYVERPQEEPNEEAARAEAKRKGYVDLWVEEGHEGFLTVAREQGIEIVSTSRRSLSAPPATTPPADIPH
ncbi:hypothetical protein LTR66_014732 [Elasticomyces elasticus]|nr:hypothetical protein LTR66_014732 [Elasticomyces elasticus]